MIRSTIRPAAVSRRSRAPLVLAVFVLLLLVGLVVKAALAACDGHLVYALDDAYIHLAMARTLAESGVWGVTPHAYGFASSSPGWTVILALAARLGITTEWLPLLLNVLAALAVLVVLDVMGRRLLVTDRARTWLLLSAVLVTPMPALVMSGMEALVHVAAVLVFVGLAARGSARTNAADRGPSPWSLALAAGVACALRYESAFVVIAAAVLLCVRRRAGLAVAASVGAAVPITAYGVYALAHGGWWVPASVMLKGEPPHLGSLAGLAAFLAGKGLPALYTQPPLPSLLIVLVLLVVAFTWAGRDLAGEAEAWVLIAAGAILVHVHALNFEWFFRYKAYLVVLGVAACVFGMSRAWRLLGLAPDTLRRPVLRYAAVIVAAGTLAGPLVITAVQALGHGIRGSRAIYLQQYQVARFLATHGTGPVVLNDIGAVAYYSGRPVVDLFGLGTQGVAEARRAGTFSTADIDRLVRAVHADVAVVYPQRFTGQIALPESWRPVATWTAAEAVSVAYPAVTWYSTSAEGAQVLRASLESWQPRLPPGTTAEFVTAPAQDTSGGASPRATAALEHDSHGN